MKKSPVLAALISMIIPGLGQIYARENNKGAAIIFAAVVIANLNILILPLISIANPILPLPSDDPNGIWKYWIPRIVHDVSALWSIAFYVWVVIDAFIITKKRKQNIIVAT